ncbi:MAG: hypothetical protein ACFFDF_24200, partial [Candidatus Odinarchaeota archaeon]
YLFQNFISIIIPEHTKTEIVIKLVINIIAIPTLAAVIGIPNLAYRAGNTKRDIASVIRLAPATPNKIKPIFLFFN